jgi:hypothetical protein
MTGKRAATGKADGAIVERPSLFYGRSPNEAEGWLGPRFPSILAAPMSPGPVCPDCQALRFGKATAKYGRHLLTPE